MTKCEINPMCSIKKVLFLLCCLTLSIYNECYAEGAPSSSGVVKQDTAKKADIKGNAEDKTPIAIKSSGVLPPTSPAEALDNSGEDLPHLPSDSVTLNNLKQLFFKARELKEKAEKYNKLVEELEKRVVICKKLADQAKIESDRIEKFIHEQLAKHEEVVEKIKAQTVKKYNMNKQENTSVEKFLAEVVKQHDDYKKTPEYKAKVNEYIRMMEEAKQSAEKRKKSLDDIKHHPVPDPSALF